MKKLAFIALFVSAAILLFGQSYDHMSSAYGELYEDNASGTTITITDATTYYPWTTTAAGSSRNVTLSTASDNMTIIQGGKYMLMASISYSGSNTTIYTWCVHVNDSCATGLKVQRTIGTGSDVGSANITGIAVLSADDTINLEVMADGASKVADVYYVMLTAVLLD